MPTNIFRGLILGLSGYLILALLAAGAAAIIAPSEWETAFYSSNPSPSNPAPAISVASQPLWLSSRYRLPFLTQPPAAILSVAHAYALPTSNAEAKAPPQTRRQDPPVTGTPAPDPEEEPTAPPEPTQVPPTLPPTPRPMPPSSPDPNYHYIPANISVIKAEPPTVGEGTPVVPPPVIRGRITNQERLPMPGITISISSGQISRTVISRSDGSFEIARLPAGIYAVAVEQHGGRAADNLRLEPGYTTVVEFVRVTPGTQMADLPAAEPTAIEEAAPTSTSLPSPSPRPTPRPVSLSGRGILDLLGFEFPKFDPSPWIEKIMIGAATVYALMLTGILYGTLRRQ